MTITHRTRSTISTQRDAWVEINLSALERNFLKVKDLVKTSIMAVLKADAYGHGATTLAPILQSLKCNSFGVATVDEGIALRNSGIKIPIVILGATPFWSYDICLKNKLTITVYSEEQLVQLEELSKKTNSIVPIQLKIDTGMNRLGINYNGVNASNIIEKIIKSSHFKLEGVFTHLANAKDYDFSKVQKERFDCAFVGNSRDCSLQKHIANSYAAVNYPDFRYDLVRIGIGLYGQEFKFLEPLISLKGRITAIHKVLEGESVSYDCTWRAKKDSIIATVPIGYADGIDRKLSNNISAIYNGEKGQEIKQVGNITMDQMMFDISNIKNAKINDVINLIDKELPISIWADKLNTITYELLCRLKMRLPRVYTRD